MFSHRAAFQIEPVAVVYQSIKDGVGERRFIEVGVPLIHGELAGDDRGLAVVPIVEDLQQIALGLGFPRYSVPQRRRLSACPQHRLKLIGCPIPDARV